MSGGWTVVDANTNKSLPVGGTQNSGLASPYMANTPASLDPVGKFRVSTPQALIDTDFEYGPQPTKWETINLQNNRQSVYYIPQAPLNVTGLNSSASTTLTITGTFVVAANTPIYIQNALDPNQNGWWWTVAGGTNSMTVITTNASVTGNQWSATATYVYVGYFYTNAGIQLSSTSAFTNVTTTVTCTTTNPHGLSAGSYIYVRGTTSSAGGAINGAWVVAKVPTANTLTFVVPTAPTGTLTNTANTITLYARPAGYVESRPFDGGVAFSAGSVVPNQQLIRQTRRYFRYQSGKGIQFSTGSALKPPLNTNYISSSSTTATVTTRTPHNLAVGALIDVFGCDQAPFNGRFAVASIVNATSFTYTMALSASNATATGYNIRITPASWFGSSNRIGMFDLQNGLFFEFDGQTLYAVWRSSTTQLAGTVTTTLGSSTVTGVNTQFTTSLNPGDWVVIRGMSYRVVTIVSDTSMYISPEFRGQGNANEVVSKTIDIRYPQSAWNIDPCNGNGPSGYNLDLTRMQMWYMDYSWYGAGTVRWGLRGPKGQIIYVNQLQNNNIQYEAYMRSGNMAAHYESNGITGYSILAQNLNSTDTVTSAAVNSQDVTINATSASTYFPSTGGVFQLGSELITYAAASATQFTGCTRGAFGTPAAPAASGAAVRQVLVVKDASQFAATGNAKVQASGQTGAIEYISYTNRNLLGNTLYGLTRAATGGAAAATTFTYSASAPVGVEYASPDTAAALSHWGSSVIMDGQFNDDKSLIFNYGTTTAITTNSTTPVVILAIRIAPSVDNGTVGLLGVKETVNRSQLQLESLGLYTTGTGYLINLVLNGYASGAMSGSFIAPIQQSGGTTSSLAQIATNTSAVNVTSGESVFAAYSNTTGNTTLDLSSVRDLGNSILGGGTTNTVPTSQSGFYPDGPDILYIVATPLSATTSTIQARLNWKEAQA
jgi:hypothetical protein